VSARLAAAAVVGACLVAAEPAQAAPIAALHHELSVALDPAKRSVRVSDRITFLGSGPMVIELGQRFAVSRLELDGIAVPRGQRADGDPRRFTLALANEGTHQIDIDYAGELAPLDAPQHRDTLGDLPPMAGAQGAFLPAGSGWVPGLGDETFSYRVTVEVPPDQRALVPGRLVSEQAAQDAYRAVYEFAQPAEGIDLMAGPYLVQERLVARSSQGAPIRLRTWFHPQIAQLAAEYLDASAAYLALYERWIGAYPYGEFSVVSSPLPTGFGMPTLTYLGIDVLRLPFIKATSLGHEILHNWWGNGVYPDWRGGNWSEGLTTFMADYAYKERESEEAARGMRLDWLRDFAAVPAAQDTPLRAFTARTHGVSQVVGYHKAAFLFLMLRDAIGKEAFDAGLRRFWSEHKFRRSTWDDLRGAFEATSGRDLSAFFAQWLDRAGAPQLRVAAARSSAAGTGYRLELELTQTQPAFDLRVPVAVRRGDRTAIRHVALTRAHQQFTLELDAQPESVSIDPDLRLFRRLERGELPPILRQAMLDAGTRTLIASQDAAMRDAVRALADALLDAGFHEAPSDPRGPLLIVGSEPDVDRLLAQRGLPARPQMLRAKGTAQVWAAYDAAGMPLLCVSARDASALRALARPLPHYGRQSWLVFEDAKALERGVWAAEPKVVLVDEPAR
jgi:hypothetical protein